jgi:hypothetical protein
MKLKNLSKQIPCLLFLFFGFFYTNLHSIMEDYTANWVPTDGELARWKAAVKSDWIVPIVSGGTLLVAHHNPGDLMTISLDKGANNPGTISIAGIARVAFGIIGQGWIGTIYESDGDINNNSTIITRSDMQCLSFDITHTGGRRIYHELNNYLLEFTATSSLTAGHNDGVIEWAPTVIYKNGDIDTTASTVPWFNFANSNSTFSFQNIYFISDPYCVCGTGNLDFDSQCKFRGGLTLPMDLDYKSEYSIYGALDFNDLTLTLVNTDLWLASGGSITGNGTIVGDGNAILLNSDQTYDNILSFSTSNATIDGGGYILDLNNSGRFTVASGVTLLFKNITLKNLRSDWKSGAGLVKMGAKVNIIP